MLLLSDEEIKQYNEQGFLPGPKETEEEFIKRINFCLHLEQELSQQTGTDFPFSIQNQDSQNVLEEASSTTWKLYGILPNWIPLFFSNYQLSPWHGGCAWIFQWSEKTSTAAFLQLRAAFQKQKQYLGLYKRSELVAHEIAHVGRMMYQEPQFEEILAYQTSSSFWRRWLGPIVQSSKESLLFILLLALLVFAHFTLLMMNSSATYQVAFWLDWTFIACLSLAFFRLGLRQWQFYRCLNRLTDYYQNKEKAHHVIYRLTDQEIRLFASLSPQKIHQFMRTASQSSFRWKYLLKHYPLKTKKTIFENN